MKKVIGLLSLAAVLVTTGISPVLAETSQKTPVEITVRPGEFSLTAPTVANFTDVELGGDVQKRAVGFDGAFRVKDLRGTQAGWRISATGTEFATADGLETLPAGSMTLAPVTEITRVHTGSSADKLPVVGQTAPKAIDGQAAIEVAKAAVGFGMGIHDISFDADKALEVSIDSVTAKSGNSYTSTITWDLLQAP